MPGGQGINGAGVFVLCALLRYHVLRGCGGDWIMQISVILCYVWLCPVMFCEPMYFAGM